jgi:hypothetical protein
MAMRLGDANLVLEALESKKQREANMTKVKAITRADRRLAVTVMDSGLNLYQQTVHDILTEDCGMRTVGCCITTTLPISLLYP